MISTPSIIETFKVIKLNHKETVKTSNNKKRQKHVETIIKQRRIWKETKTVHIVNGIKHKLYW